MWAMSARQSLLVAILAFVKQTQAQGWPYQGCYTDNVLSRTLRGEHFTDASSMSRSLCTLTCAHRDFSYAGLEFGKECYCGYLLNPAATLTSDAECNMPCAGNPEEDCGAADRISVYYNGNPLPTIQPTAGTFSYVGCYTDSVSNRVLPFQADFPFGTDPDRCTAACKTSGYKYAGLEFGSECWCGKQLLAFSFERGEPFIKVLGGLASDVSVRFPSGVTRRGA
ncbi:hypothetical protein AB1N83_010698 [Pleurotus pulmonarius]